MLLLLHQQGETTELARVHTPIPASTWLRLRAELAGPAVRVWSGGLAAPLIDVSGERLSGTGQLGVRVSGEPLEFGSLSVETAGRTWPVEPDPAGPPADRALEALCLTLLNSNEFVYID